MATGLVLDLDWIVEGLAVGAAIPAGATDLLSQAGIGAVVDVRDEDCDDCAGLERAGIRMLHVPAPDGHGLPPPDLERGASWILEQRAEGKRVLVHCRHGIGRSSLVACCALVLQGLEPLEAFKLARARRPVITWSPSQMKSFLAWVQSTGSTAPAYEELALLSWGRPPLLDGFVPERDRP